MTTLPETARTIFNQALADCSVEQATARRFHVRDGLLHIDEETIELSSLQRIRIVAVGKAANAMLIAVWRQLLALSDIDIAGIVNAPERSPQLPRGFQFFAGGHPSPNEASFAGAQASLDMLRAAAKEPGHTLCLLLISGGASAMMELPLDPAITLAETMDFHRALVASGASITEINCIRKHFSAVKGGRLALAAGGALCRSLLISDVPAGREDALGSGPTLPDVSTVDECREILARYSLLSQFPAAVRRFFESDALPETPKPGQLSAHFHVLLDSGNLERAAALRAEALGWTAVIDDTCDDWDYRDAAKYLLDRLRGLRREHPQVCLISAGEITVSLPADHKNAQVGIGGRNQQFALYSATLLTPEDGAVAILSAGSDGIDGNSSAAGAIVDEKTASDPVARTEALQALENFDAHSFLAARNATITTGPSGNNLRDLRILLA
jgi:glycerate 2-kinase